MTHGDDLRPDDAASVASLTERQFWLRPVAEREAVFTALRSRPGLTFFAEEKVAFLEPGAGFWAVTRYADLRTASAASSLYSSEPSAITIADLPPELATYFGSLINMDGPRHVRLRRLVARAFTPRAVEALAKQVDHVVAEIVDEVARDDAVDFVAQVAREVPQRIMAAMIGVPSDLAARITRDLTGLQQAIARVVAHQQARPDPTAIRDFATALAATFDEILAGRTRSDGDDLISVLMAASIDDEPLTHAELISFFILLSVAGNETTTNAIAHTLRLLTDAPDERARLVADLDGLLPSAVEELLRLSTPTIRMRRTVTADTTLAGTPLSRGDKVVLYYWSANRDETVFAEPHRLDLSRTPNPHVAFGGLGPHYCLGAHLARLELSSTLRRLLTVLPHVRTTGPPERAGSDFLDIVARQPFTFTRPVTP